MSEFHYQTLNDSRGAVTHVVVPVEDFRELVAGKKGDARIPVDVADMCFDDGFSPLKAWRKYMRKTQEQMAERMGVTRSAYTQMEQSERPQRKTLENAAQALGIDVAQLAEMYDDESADI